MPIFDRTTTLLESSLDVRLARHASLAEDVANADTPGYRPHEVDFASSLADAVNARLHAETPGIPGELPIDGPTAPMRPALLPPETETTGGGLDGNAVALDHVLTALVDNALQYEGATKAVSRKLAILKHAASDGTA